MEESDIIKMNDEELELFFKYHLATCERSELLGASRHILDILRKSKEPLMTKNIAEEVMKIKGLDISDSKLFFSIQHTLYATLKRQKTSKIIYSIKDFGEAEKFKIA